MARASTESPRLFFLGSTNCAITLLTLTKLTTAGVLFPRLYLGGGPDCGPAHREQRRAAASRRTLRRNETENGVTMATTARLTPEESKVRGQGQREATPRGAMANLSERPADYDPVARLMWQGETPPERPALAALHAACSPIPSPSIAATRS